MVKESPFSLSGVHDGAQRHQAFLALIFVTFFIWTTYRLLFQFPVWFDETLGKTVFFGLPVWLYVILSQSTVPLRSLRAEKLYPGLLLGLAWGGMYGFVGTLAVLMGSSGVQSAALFLSSTFWTDFFLAVATGFWESLFFFGWIFAIAEKRFPAWGRLQVMGFVMSAFVLFHIPNLLLRVPLYAVPSQLFLVAFFALGQCFLFVYHRNIYALTLSHAIWGMVLLVYAR